MSAPILCWLQERKENCIRIADDKSGEDKAGWLDDARYFEATIEEIAALEAQNRQLREIESRLDHRLNERLCEMKPEWDDSITGFNEAWDIARSLFAEVRAALAATEPPNYYPSTQAVHGVTNLRGPLVLKHGPECSGCQGVAEQVRQAKRAATEPKETK